MTGPRRRSLPCPEHLLRPAISRGPAAEETTRAVSGGRFGRSRVFRLDRAASPQALLFSLYFRPLIFGDPDILAIRIYDLAKDRIRNCFIIRRNLTQIIKRGRDILSHWYPPQRPQFNSFSTLKQASFAPFQYSRIAASSSPNSTSLEEGRVDPKLSTP